MRFTTVAVAVGLVVGLVTGGRLGNVGWRRLHALPLLAAGAALQLVHSAAGLVLSYLCLGAFALANLPIVGMGVVTIGLALNALVVTVNGGMPVRRGALEAAGVVGPGEVAVYEGKRHLEAPADRLRFLGRSGRLAPAHAAHRAARSARRRQRRQLRQVAVQGVERGPGGRLLQRRGPSHAVPGAVGVLGLEDHDHRLLLAYYRGGGGLHLERQVGAQLGQGLEGGAHRALGRARRRPSHGMDTPVGQVHLHLLRERLHPHPL
jgi:hypothetical protein